MKKLIAIILTLIMLLGLVACSASQAEAPTADTPAADASAVDSQPTAEESEEVHLLYWGTDASDAPVPTWLQEIATEFATQYKAETGTTVTFEYVGQGGYSEVAEKLTVGSVSGELPVLAYLEESLMPQFHPLCADLSSYISEEDLGNYNDGMLVSCYHGGVLKALPMGRSIVQFVVNADLVKEAGYTVDDIKTWDDVHTISKAIASLGDDMYGYGLYWDSDAWMWESALYSNGGQVVSDDGTTVTFADNDVGAIYMALIKEMILDGSCYVPYTEQDIWGSLVERFENGSIGMANMSSSLYSYLCNEKEAGNCKDFELVSMIQPAGLGGNSVVTGGGNIVIMDSATEAQKQAAVAFLKFFASDENQAQWYKVAGYMPVTDSAYTSTYMADIMADPNIENLRAGYLNAHARPQTPYWREMYGYIYEKLMDFSVNPQNYDPYKLNRDLADYCQNIIDENA